MKFPKDYDRNKVYGLLLEGFTVLELRSLCYEKGFENLRYELPQGDVRIPEIAQKIIDFATRQRLFDELFKWACKKNPRVCEEFELYQRGVLPQREGPDLFSAHEASLRQMQEQMGEKHPRYSEFLVYQQRLLENIAQSKRYGDTEAWKAERAEIIDRLNDLTTAILGVSFIELGGLSPHFSLQEKGPFEYDVFICHATEDKDDFVNPLAEMLLEVGIRVWYDKFVIEWGDTLTQVIDKGLIHSRYGIVVLSKSFFQKKGWTQYELSGLWSREIDGCKVILPIWHKITKAEIISFAPTLANKIALDTSRHSLQEIVRETVKMVNKPQSH